MSQIYIPTPATLASTIQYDRLYPPRFSEPASYIRSSSTVEDCIGCPYCITEADDEFLKAFNQKRPKAQQCSEDLFEEVMNFFENTSQAKQPFAAVDNPPVISYEEMETAFDDDDLNDEARNFAKAIYEHWKDQRLKRGNKPLLPRLKFETGQDTDDTDPYVCFRRREVRQTRKTRGRDAQVTDKLRTLRQELESARMLVAKVKERENLRREQLRLDKQIFEQRSAVRRHKQEHSMEGGDEDLINQKVKDTYYDCGYGKAKIFVQPVKRRPADSTTGPRQSGANLRISLRPDTARSSEQSLSTLQEVQAQKENAIQKFIETQVAADRQELKGSGFIDLTWRPLTPPLDGSQQPSFQAATTEYLPTPPASVSSENSGDNLNADGGSPFSPRSEDAVLMQYSHAVPCHPRTSFRRRIGRGGRIWIDRRREPFQSPLDTTDHLQDRFRFDNDVEEETPIYYVNPYDSLNIKRRAEMFIPHRDLGALPPAAQPHTQTANRRTLPAHQSDIVTINGRSTAAARSGNLGITAVRPASSRSTS